jgi:hypothetical protein
MLNEQSFEDRRGNLNQTLALFSRAPDANTIWTFREALTRARTDGEPAIGVPFERSDAAVQACGYLAMGGQIADATIIAAPSSATPRTRSRRSRKAAFGRIGRSHADQAPTEGP